MVTNPAPRIFKSVLVQPYVCSQLQSLLPYPSGKFCLATLLLILSTSHSLPVLDLSPLFRIIGSIGIICRDAHSLVFELLRQNEIEEDCHKRGHYDLISI